MSAYTITNSQSNPQYFEHHLVNIEHGLTCAAIIPVIGTISGAIRVCLGVIQTVFGIIGGILSGVIAPFSKTARQIFYRSMDHVANGIVNIIAGIFEAIPLLGSVFAITKGLAARVFQRHPGHYVLVGYNILDPIENVSRPNH